MRFDSASDFYSGYKRRWRGLWVRIAVTPHHVGVVDAGSFDADQDLAGPGRGYRYVLQDQNLRASGLVESNGLHRALPTEPIAGEG